MTSQPLMPLKLMLIDSDSAFRQRFITCLEPYPNLQVAVEAESGVAALQMLSRHFDQPAATAETPIDLVILSLDLLPSEPVRSALPLCRELRYRYPTLPVLAIDTNPAPAVLVEAYQAGAAGYCQKETAVADLVQLICQVAAGYSNWTQGMDLMVQAIAPQAITPQATAPVATAPVAISANLARLRRRVRQSGLSQIDSAIAQLNDRLTAVDSASLDELFLAGRRRELQAARWVVNRLLMTAAERQAERHTASPPGASTPTAPRSTSSFSQAKSPPVNLSAPLVAPQPTAIRHIQAALFDSTAAKLQFNLRNLTDAPLEIDILNHDRKRELLTLVLRQLENVLAELRFSQVDLAQLAAKQPMILQNLWQSTTADFFGRYYTLPLSASLVEQPYQPAIDMVEVLLQDTEIVQAEILSKIPLLPEFLAHLLFQIPLTIDDATCAAGTVEAMARMEALLQNLIIQVANAVIQPLLNRFGDVVAVKQNFYDRRLLSTREIERFRNSLSWKYRVARYFGEPTAIFESRYGLLILQEQGIVKTSIYSPRNQEMNELSGLPLAVTIALETRDALSPRLRSAISFVGSGVVYVLTEIIGRGIGLIGRGIIKGVGNVVQDTRFSHNSERR